MRVRCKFIINPATGEREQESSWIRVGREYVVLGVEAVPGRGVSFRIEDAEQGSSSMWNSEMFDVVDPALPKSWVAQVDGRGTLFLEPEAWLEDGYWERFFDRDPVALDAYDRESALIKHADLGDLEPTEGEDNPA